MHKFLLLTLLFPAMLSAQGGMWLPMYLEKYNEKEMRALGCKIKADAIYHANRASLKDAICQFDGGCTGEMISPEGLLLTNHHCGFDAIQQLSSIEHNYIDNGYWAKSRAEELPAKGVTAMFVVRMEDVTTLALNGVADNMSEKDRQTIIDKNLDNIRRSTKKESWEQVSTRPFYAGNQFFLFVTVTYTDVRLVGAPPAGIGKFGSDTDNWVWPRHTGDFSIFRVYADKDNKPAAYSKDNVPYRPKHFLPISIKGIQENDFTMVYGFPGRTDEYLPAEAVRQIAQVTDPARVAIRDRALKTMDAFMRKDAGVKIAYIARYASIANAWKKWLGEMQGLLKVNAVAKKQAYEAEFTNAVAANPDWKIQYGNLLPRLNTLHKEIEPYALARDIYLETFIRNIEATGVAAGMQSWLESWQKNGESFFVSKIPAVKDNMSGFFKDYRIEVDQAVFAALLELYAQKMPEQWGGNYANNAAAKAGGFSALAAELYGKSVLTDQTRFNDLMEKTPKIILETLSNDPLYTFWKNAFDLYAEQVQPTLQSIQPNITMLQRQYMAAQMTVFRNKKRFFPDANSTLRLTYGKVNGYRPRDAVYYEFLSDLDGVMEKYIPGDYEFDVPKRLVELWEKKDYGPYANAEGKLPVAFIATNHTTGGNSGSPALDGRGNLIGLNFDRVWEGTMSDINYDPSICRNIMVDARYILFIIDKFGGAGYLLKEMTVLR